MNRFSAYRQQPLRRSCTLQRPPRGGETAPATAIKTQAEGATSRGSLAMAYAGAGVAALSPRRMRSTAACAEASGGLTQMTGQYPIRIRHANRSLRGQTYLTQVRQSTPREIPTTCHAIRADQYAARDPSAFGAPSVCQACPPKEQYRGLTPVPNCTWRRIGARRRARQPPAPHHLIAATAIACAHVTRSSTGTYSSIEWALSMWRGP
jgi:hypothetical protein